MTDLKKIAAEHVSIPKPEPEESVPKVENAEAGEEKKLQKFEKFLTDYTTPQTRVWTRRGHLYFFTNEEMMAAAQMEERARVLGIFIIPIKKDDFEAITGSTNWAEGWM